MEEHFNSLKNNLEEVSKLQELLENLPDVQDNETVEVSGKFIRQAKVGADNVFNGVHEIIDDTLKISEAYTRVLSNIEFLEQQRTRLENDLNTVSANYSALEKKLKETKERLEQLRNENDKLQSHSKHLINQIDSLSARSLELGENNHQLKQSEQQLLSELSKAKNYLKELQDFKTAYDLQTWDYKELQRKTNLDKEKLILGDFATQFKIVLGEIIRKRIDKVQDVTDYLYDPHSDQTKVKLLRDMDFKNDEAVKALDDSIKQFMDIRNKIAHPAISFQKVSLEQLEVLAKKHDLESQFHVIAEFWSKLLNYPNLIPEKVWRPK